MFNSYMDVQYLKLKEADIAYYLIKNTMSKKYLIWLNSKTNKTEDCYAKLLDLESNLQINVIMFDYQGKGNSRGLFNNRNSYVSFKSIIKNINTITGTKVSKKNLIFCGEEFGATLIKKYMKHHKYYKCIIINPPNDHLRSFKKKRNKVCVLSMSTKSVAYDDHKYFKKIYSQEALIKELNEFLASSKNSKT